MANAFRFILVGALGCALGSCQAANVKTGPDLAEMRALAVKAKNDDALRAQLAPFLQEAEKIRALPVVRRAFSLEELRAAPDGRLGSIDGRTKNVEALDAKKANIFALAMADTDTAGLLARELPLLSAAYVLTGDRAYRDRVTAQLREAITWQPLQRPGWNLYTASNSLPPGGRDGVWLATGLGLLAICQTLQIFPPDELPADLRAKINQLLEREIAQIREDWKTKLPWYVKNRAAVSNQWVVPSAGLMVAAVALGRETHADAYEEGVRQLTETLAALGDEGAVSEGPAYAAHWTAPFLYVAARTAAQTGDDRLASHGFLKNFPRWLVGTFQPGQSVVNCFDNFGGARGLYPLQTGDVSRLAALTRDPALLWILRHQIRVTSLDFYGLIAAGLPATDEKEPPLWGSFDRARWVVWRDGWKDEASGVWIRGGHELDAHDHNDRGHVNFIVNGKTVLMEAATAGYSEPRLREDFQSVKGHNVLQVGDDLFPKKSSAALDVARLDATGGDVTVEVGAGYAGVSRWKRRVVWDHLRMEITDEVALDKPAVVRFRWHLGSEQSLAFSEVEPKRVATFLPAGKIIFAGWNGKLPAGLDWTPPARDEIQTPEVKIAVEADQPVICSEEKNVDHALKFRNWTHLHTTLLVRSQEAVSSIRIQTVVEAK